LWENKNLAEKQHTGKKKWLIWLIFWIYMGVMIYFLFLGDRYGNPYHEYHYNLTLFQEIRRFIIYREHVGTVSFLMNVFGNVFAFSPFGFFLPLLSCRVRSWWKVLLLSFELTFCIECAQLVTRLGVFDVDDLCMNVLGGITGYWIYLMVRKILQTLRKEEK
jgi:glycopeptide antibiotics resistance protein